MSFIRQNVNNYYLYDTQVENLFLSEYMPSAPEGYVKLYLAAQMSAQSGRPFAKNELSGSMASLAAVWDDCWAYWEAQGIARRKYPDPSDRNVYHVELLSLREAAFGRRTPGVELAPQRAVSLDDKKLASLYTDVEASTGRLLEPGEPEEIASWIRDYRIDPDVIVFGYRYCSEKRRSSRCRYVGAVLKDWKSKGLSCVSDVEAYLSEMDRHYEMYRKVCRQLGFHRNPTEAEKKIMDIWFDQWNFSMEKVLEACNRTSGISNPNINYVNSVLKGWYEEQHADPLRSVNVFALVEKAYEKDREENNRKTEERRRQIVTQIPRIADIMKEIREVGMRRSRAFLSGKDPARAEADRRKMAHLQQEKRDLLREAGFPEDAADKIYTCAKCRDTGLLEDGSRCACYDGKLQLIRLQAMKDNH